MLYRCIYCIASSLMFVLNPKRSRLAKMIIDKYHEAYLKHLILVEEPFLPEKNKGKKMKYALIGCLSTLLFNSMIFAETSHNHFLLEMSNRPVSQLELRVDRLQNILNDPIRGAGRNFGGKLHWEGEDNEIFMSMSISNKTKYVKRAYCYLKDEMDPKIVCELFFKRKELEKMTPHQRVETIKFFFNDVLVQACEIIHESMNKSAIILIAKIFEKETDVFAKDKEEFYRMVEFYNGDESKTPSKEDSCSVDGPTLLIQENGVLHYQDAFFDLEYNKA